MDDENGELYEGEIDIGAVAWLSHRFRADNDSERLPDESDFLTLRPGETHSVETEYGVQADGDLGPKRGQDSAKYFIQVMVTTWYFYEDPQKYRDHWRDRGYLWSQGVKSEPMSFTIKRNQ